MGEYFKIIGVGIVAGTCLFSSAPAVAAKAITVYPKNAKAFRCQVGPERLPVTVEDGMLTLKVGTVGAEGPYYWRVPFRSWNNGDNAISLAQAGDTTSKDSEFTIAVDVMKLPVDNEAKKIELRLFSKNGKETVCTTQIAAIEEAATVAVQLPQPASQPAQEKTPPPVPVLTEQAAVQ